MRIDLHFVEEQHRAIHARLLNWARWVTPTTGSAISPMFRQAQSNSRQWHAPEIRETVDILDAQRMERQVCTLEQRQRLALKWAYVQRTRPGKATRRIAQTDRELMDLIHHARQCLHQLDDSATVP